MKLKGDHESSGLFGIESGLSEGELPAFFSVDSALLESRDTKNRSTMGATVSSVRLRIAVIACLGVLGIFTARVSFLQLYLGDYYRGIAESNRIRIHAIPAHRGILKDRNGITLAENLPSFRVVAYQSVLPAPKESDDEVKKKAAEQARLDLLTKVSERFTLSLEDIKLAIIEAGNTEEVLLTEDVPYETALAYIAEAEPIPGIKVELSERRGYPTNAIPSLSHVLGYTGPVNEKEYTELEDLGYRKFDVVGKQGIEAAHETELRGTFGEEVFEVNAKGSLLRTVSRREPVDGKDLTLTLDARLQAYSELALAKHLEGREVKRASVVAIDPRNGDVLALVSYPSFDANLFAQGISQDEYQALLDDPGAPLFPRATSGEYPAGSTMKPMFAAAALTEGIITPQTSFFSVGGLMLGDRFFPDWRPGGHGATNVYHALADSVNTFFYLIGGGNETFNGLGLEKLMTYAAKFGFGSKTGIDLTGEADGFLPTKAWKQEVKGEPWYIGDTYNVSIGQGDLLVTPLQMAVATAAVANGGDLVTPHLVLGAEVPQPHEIIAGDVMTIVRDGMRQTVVGGTGRSLQSIPVPVAAKTGTAQWAPSKNPHSWLSAFAPFDEPTITLVVLIEEGGDATLGVPVARDILEWYFTRN